MPDKSSLQDLPPKGTLLAVMDDDTEATSTDSREKYDFYCANSIRGKTDQESQEMIEKESVRKTTQRTENNGYNSRLQ